MCVYSVCVCVSLFFCVLVWCYSREWELDSVLVWSHWSVVLYWYPPLLHHHVPWRYTLVKPVWTLKRSCTKISIWIFPSLSLSTCCCLCCPLSQSQRAAAWPSQSCPWPPLTLSTPTSAPTPCPPCLDPTWPGWRGSRRGQREERQRGRRTRIPPWRAGGPHSRTGWVHKKGGLSSWTSLTEIVPWV